MEQRIATNTPPVHAAGTDPAYVPGLTPTPPAPRAAAEPEPEPEPESESAADPVVEDEAPAAPGPSEEPADSADSEEPEETEEPVDGPVFEVSDRRGSITADHKGVRFRLDGEEADFLWDEIGAVEIDTPRFSRRFVVNVYTTSPRHRYEAEVEASARSLLKQWTAELDTVLDVHFGDTES